MPWGQPPNQQGGWGQQPQQQGGWGQQSQQQGFGGQHGHGHHGHHGQHGGFGAQGQGYSNFGGYNAQPENVPRPGQKYVIAVASQHNMVIDSSGNPRERRKGILYQGHGGENQQWMFYPAGNNAYAIVNVADQGTLEIPDHMPLAPMTQLHVAQPNRTIN